MENKDSKRVRKVKCFRCGTEIEPGREIIVHDSPKKRVLAFCSEQCRSLQNNRIKTKSGGNHYDRFPMARVATILLHREEEPPFEEFVKQFNSKKD